MRTNEKTQILSMRSDKNGYNWKTSIEIVKADNNINKFDKDNDQDNNFTKISLIVKTEMLIKGHPSFIPERATFNNLTNGVSGPNMSMLKGESYTLYTKRQHDNPDDMYNTKYGIVDASISPSVNEGDWKVTTEINVTVDSFLDPMDTEKLDITTWNLTMWIYKTNNLIHDNAVESMNKITGNIGVVVNSFKQAFYDFNE